MFGNKCSTVRAAHGRDYTNQTQIQNDWKAGKDFLCVISDKYINLEDAKNLKIGFLTVRYDRDRKSCIVKSN